MKAWREVVVDDSASIEEAIKRIDKGSAQIALVVDQSMRLLGTITDGDVRRGLLKGVALSSSVKEIMNTSPVVVPQESDLNRIFEIMKQKQLRHMPIVDSGGRLCGLELLDELSELENKDNSVILMAGGLGSRLSPLTEACPKPMLDVGGRPILETILQHFSSHGFKDFYISINYMGKMIQEYFKGGEDLGISIRYLQEDKRMGTAGALSLLPARPEKAFFVMNADVLTNINFNNLLEFHNSYETEATMCVREFKFEVPYGVLRLNGYKIEEIEEKPIQKFFVNSGIYVLEPSVLDQVQSRDYLDMPMLFDKLIKAERKTLAFPIREYWLDIGRHEDFERANGDYKEFFKG